MRVVNRKEFLALPSGTLFCVLGSTEPRVKHESLSNDWIESDIVSVDYWERDEKSFKLDTEASGRDGYFEMEDMYMIYERDDLKKVIGVLNECLGVANDKLLENYNPNSFKEPYPFGDKKKQAEENEKLNLHLKQTNE